MKARKASAAGVRRPSDTDPTAERPRSPNDRSRSSVCTWCVKNAPRRVVLPTCSSRRSRSCTWRSACARLRDARHERKCKRFEIHAPMAARARRGRPVTRSPSASSEAHDDADGHQPHQREERVRREQDAHTACAPAQTRPAGRRGGAPPPPRGARHARRVRPARVRRRAGRASRGRGPRSRGRSPASNPPSCANRSTRTSIVAVVT